MIFLNLQLIFQICKLKLKMFNIKLEIADLVLVLNYFRQHFLKVILYLKLLLFEKFLVLV
jgi:hypothetical protein